MAKIKKITQIKENSEAINSKTIGLVINYEDGTEEKIEFKRNQFLNFEFERLVINVLWADFQKSSLRGCNFIGSLINTSDLRKSDLSWSNFEGVSLSGSTLNDCNFTGANFIKAGLNYTNGFTHLDINNEDNKRRFRGAIFVDASMPQALTEDDLNNMKQLGAIMDRAQLRELLDEMKELNSETQITPIKAIQYLSILKNFEALKGLRTNPVVNEVDKKALEEKFGVLMQNGVVGEILEKKEQYFVEHAQKIKAINTASGQNLPVEVIGRVAEFAELPFENKIPQQDKSQQDQNSYQPLTGLGRKLFESAGFLAPKNAVVEHRADQLQLNTEELQH